MLNENFVILGFIIQMLGSFKYIIGTIQGNVKPNKVTFFLWSLAPLIAFAAQIKQGVGIQSLMTFSVGFFPLLTFIASFVNKKATWKLGTFDLFCGALSDWPLILVYHKRWEYCHCVCNSGRRIGSLTYDCKSLSLSGN